MREVEVKIAMKYHLSTRMAIEEKKQITASVADHMEKLEPLYTAGTNIKSYSHV